MSATKIYDKENYAPVSFLRDGYQDENQVHLGGTYAFLPRHLNPGDGAGPANWDNAEQLARLGDVYFEAGIRNGFTPCSQSYLSNPEAARMIDALVQEGIDAKFGRTDALEDDPASEDPAPTAVDLDAPVEDDEESESEAEEELDPETQAVVLWADVESLTLAEIRERLAEADQDTVDAYVEWELARPKPRKSILNELGVEVED